MRVDKREEREREERSRERGKRERGSERGREREREREREETILRMDRQIGIKGLKNEKKKTDKSSSKK